MRRARSRPSLLHPLLGWGPRHAILALIVLAGCSSPAKSTEDLEDGDVTLIRGAVEVRVNADQLPNVGHLCWDEDSGIGVWTTTDRVVIIVYNDWFCPGSSVEREMVVLTGTPRASVAAP